MAATLTTLTSRLTLRIDTGTSANGKAVYKSNSLLVDNGVTAGSLQSVVSELPAIYAGDIDRATVIRTELLEA